MSSNDISDVQVGMVATELINVWVRDWVGHSKASQKIETTLIICTEKF